MKKLSLLLTGVILLGACNKKTVDAPNGVCGVAMLPLDATGYFAFGSKYGMCPSNCATFFEIKNSNLYPDHSNALTRNPAASVSVVVLIMVSSIQVAIP
jgi:hypothetical protein